MYRLRRLTPTHREILRLRAAGLSPKEVADRLGVCLQTVYNVQNEPQYLEAMKELQAKIDDLLAEELVEDIAEDPVRERLREVAMEALEEDIRLMREGSERARQRSVFDILDRAGYARVEEQRFSGSLVLDKKNQEALFQALEATRKAQDADMEEYLQLSKEDDPYGYLQREQSSNPRTSS